MCGINVIFDPRQRLPDKAALVRRMNNQMIYRGPDDEGFFTEGEVALGVRRLSIIDVEGGHQPLFNEDRSLALVFNGEIYNFVELAEQLKRRCHRFASRSDGEVILHLYEEKGERCLEDLRGMFAFVLWDGRRRRLFAARDRVGIKPLYVAERDGVLWLSSELKAIIRAGGVTPTVRPAAVYQFLVHSFPLDQRNTLVEEIKRVLPGEYLFADESGTTFRRYWLPRFGGDTGIVERPDEEILDVLASAVSQHLRSDVPVAILFSGGIDSSAVAAFAAREGKSCAVLCAGYEGYHPSDERPIARAVASSLGLPYADVILDGTVYERDYQQLVLHADEPVGDVAAVPQWSLYREASRLGYKVVLSGVGGDEVFFGYPEWNGVGEACRRLTTSEFSKWVGFDHAGSTTASRILTAAIGGKLVRDVAAEIDAPLHALRDLAPQGPDAINSLLFGTYLVHNGCQLADKLGMGCSVEVRVPFLDHVLVQTVFDQPLVRRFEPACSKPMLRRLLRGIVPDAVLRSKKRNFTPPGDYVDALVTSRIDLLLHGFLCGTGLVDRARLTAIISQQGKMPWLRFHRLRNLLGVRKMGWFLFRLLALESWHSTVIGSEIAQGGQPYTVRP